MQTRAINIPTVFTKKKYDVEEIRLGNHSAYYWYNEEVEGDTCYFYYFGDDGTICRAMIDKDDTAHEANDYTTEVEVVVVGLLPTSVSGENLIF